MQKIILRINNGNFSNRCDNLDWVDLTSTSWASSCYNGFRKVEEIFHPKGKYLCFQIAISEKGHNAGFRMCETLGDIN